MIIFAMFWICFNIVFTMLSVTIYFSFHYDLSPLGMTSMESQKRINSIIMDIHN